VEILDYPSIVDFDEQFGTDPIVAIQSNKASYKLETISAQKYNYYTIAVYQNTYGLTDRRKPEFKLTMRSYEVYSPLTTQTHLSSSEPELALSQL